MANRKALIVGIDHYQTSPLTAAVAEAERWKRLLEKKYQFEVNAPDETKATRGGVIDALRWLLSDTNRDDQRAFIFCGHGTTIAKNGGNFNAKPEEAILVFPGDPAVDRISATDISAVIQTTRPPAGARFTMVLDCCFAGLFELAPAGMTYLSVMSSYSGPRTNGSSPHRLGTRAGLEMRGSEHLDLAWPVVVAACGADEDAVQDGRRLLFSREIQKELTAHPKETYAGAMGRVEAAVASEVSTQHPELHGNRQRLHHRFFN